MKRCSRCRVGKPLGEFHHNRTRLDGLSDDCKACKKNIRKPEVRWAQRSPARLEQLRAYGRERYHELYAPGRPRWKKRSVVWQPKTVEHAERHRENHRQAKARYNRKPSTKALARVYYQRANVKEKMRQRYHEAMQNEEYVMKRREYMRQRRKNDPEYAKREDARIIVNIMVRWGWMQRGPCAVCGIADKVEGHHPNYDDPLSVVWLCRPHHRIEHYPHLALLAGEAL